MSIPLEILARAIIASILIFSFLGAMALMAIWAERKVSGRIQDRYGPTRTGPWGLLQSVADGIKLITKEDIRPNPADRFLFRLAPYMAFCATFASFLALPFGDGIVAFELSISIFFILAVLSSEVFGIILAGLASANKWSLFGGVREAAQVVSYEVPRSLCVIVPVCLAGTLSLSEFSHQQVGGFWNWYVFHNPMSWMAFVTFFVTATASCKRAPFDLAEAESELVAGFHTEYSGIRWSYFFLAEYGSMFALGAIASHLFLGGWNTGLFANEATAVFGYWIGNTMNVMVLMIKSMTLMLIMMWLRWSLPRLRIDQVMTACLKYLLPISCCLLLGNCLWQLMIPMHWQHGVSLTLAWGSVILTLAFMAWLFRSPDVPNHAIWTMAGQGGHRPAARSIL